MSGLGPALCALLLAGAVRADPPWYAWASLPLLLLVHDLTYGVLRALAARRHHAHARGRSEHASDPFIPAPVAVPPSVPMHALAALLVATFAASASAIAQSPAYAPAGIVAPVITGLVPVLLMGAPPTVGVAWLARQALFALATALAAVAATQHAHVDAVAQFFLACLAAGIAEVVFAPARPNAAPAPAEPARPESDPT